MTITLPPRPRPAPARAPQRRPAPGRGRAQPARRPPTRPASPPRIGRPERRQGALTAMSLAVLLVFAARLVWIQAVQAEDLAAQALEARLVTVEVAEPRADIIDRNGVVLATSVDRYHIWVNQRRVADWQERSQGVVVAEGPRDAAVLLAPLLGMEEAELAEAMTGDSGFVYLAKNVSRETMLAVRQAQVQGVEWEPTSERLYPNGNVAGNVVGFMGGREDRQGQWGLAGLELAFEEQMMGIPGELTYERSRENVVIPTGVRSETPGVPGSTVVTTIDRDMQWQAQQRLQKAVRDTRSEWGAVVVMDVETGEVYALADSDTVDPSAPGASDAADRGSRAVSAVFEPGSTGKVVTVAALIEEGLATPTSRIRSPYSYTTKNGQTFRDSHEHATWDLTLTGVLARSSNTGTVRAGARLSEQQRHDYLSAFGFGERTGVGLPGESRGILHDVEDWDGRTKYAVLFGQGVSTTAMQVTQVYAAIANGGVLVQPTVVQGLRGADGVVVPRETADPRRVVSEETAAQVLSMLESAVVEGTGGRGGVDGYRIAGKTGTAQTLGPDGEVTGIVASFVGIAPADNPRIVVSVILYNPRGDVYGGRVAAPVFADITSYALQALGVPPSEGDATLYPLFAE